MKKISILLAILFLFPFAACGGGESPVTPNPPEPTVDPVTLTLYVDGAVYRTLTGEESVALPSTPSKIGYTFDGWYTDASFTAPFSGEQVRETCSLYGRFLLKESTVRQLILDNTYQNAFFVNKQTNNVAGSIGELVYTDDQKGTDHAWELCQWNSGYYHKVNGEFPENFNMANAVRTVSEDGTYTWRDQEGGSKVFSANPETGTVYMEISGIREFPEPRPVGGAFMTYVLNFNLNENPRLSDVSKVTLEFEYTLEKYEKAENARDQAQFVIYFILRNVNKESPDYQHWMWFGLYPYDNRYDFAPGHSAIDTGGTNGYIYGIAAEHYLSNPVQVGNENYIFLDLKPWMETALASARNYGLFMNSTLEDIELQGGNFGWEVGGAYDVGMRVSLFNLYGDFGN